MEMGGTFLKNLELYPPSPPLQVGSGECPFWVIVVKKLKIVTLS